MNETLASLQVLISEIASLLSSGTAGDRREAGRKLKRVSDMADTLALTLKLSR